MKYLPSESNHLSYLILSIKDADRHLGDFRWYKRLAERYKANGNIEDEATFLGMMNEAADNYRKSNAEIDKIYADLVQSRIDIAAVV